jgi:hypothetical protein
MSEGTVRQWCSIFEDKQTKVHDEEQSGRPSVVIDGCSFSKYKYYISRHYTSFCFYPKHHNNMCPHTAACTRLLLEHINWELFDHPPYSPAFTPSDCHLFAYMKNWLRSQHFNNNEELMEGVKMWLSSQAADFFDIGLQKHIP